MAENSKEPVKNINLFEGIEIKGERNQKIRADNQQLSPPADPILLYGVWVYNELYNPPLNIVEREAMYMEKDGLIVRRRKVETIPPGFNFNSEFGSCLNLACYAIRIFFENNTYMDIPSRGCQGPSTYPDGYYCYDFWHIFYDSGLPAPSVSE